MKPVVSCVLATRNRRGFVRQALRCFAAQDYVPRELIVVDDGDRPVDDLCADTAGVTYIRLRASTPTGTKLNVAVEAARGDILQKLDDDDFYAPRFLSTAAARLRRARREDALVAWCCFLVLIAREPRLYFSGHGWRAGGTLCFHRAMWRRHPFRALYTSSDSWFIRDNRPWLARVCAAAEYMVVRHGANTWRRIDGYGAAENYFRLRPSRRTLHAVIGRRHAPFYRSLMSGATMGA